MTCSGQSVPIVEKLADGSFVVKIDSQEFRALPADKIREIQKQKVELDGLKQIDAEKDSQIASQAQEIALLKKDVEIVGMQRDSFDADFKRSQEDAKRWQGLFIGERALRQESAQFIGRSSTPNGFFGKFLTLLDHPASQALFKVGLPMLNTIRCQR